MDDNVTTVADDLRRLMGELDLERHQLIRNIETCRIRDIERPFVGEWSLKDIVGHVASWEAEVVSSLRDVREGKRPSLLVFDESQLDRWNQDHVERKRDIDFWSLMQQLRHGRDRLLEEVALVPGAEFVDASSLSRRLVHSLIDHDRTHWHEIAALLAGMAGARATGPSSIPEEVEHTS
jgi:hypothetical protein